MGADLSDLYPSHDSSGRCSWRSGLFLEPEVEGKEYQSVCPHITISAFQEYNAKEDTILWGAGYITLSDAEQSGPTQS